MVALLLAYEHSLVSARDLSKLNAAFFTMNGVISVVFFLFLARGSDCDCGVARRRELPLLRQREYCLTLDRRFLGCGIIKVMSSLHSFQTDDARLRADPRQGSCPASD